MQAQLLYTPLDSKLEKEIIAYCSLTNSSTSNLNFLFSYYLNHYNYAPAIDVYHRLMKLDATSQAQQQRKVMIESVCELVPHIQKKLCEIPTNNHGNEQGKSPKYYSTKKLLWVTLLNIHLICSLPFFFGCICANIKILR
jgi:hypothetical protein